MMTGLWLFLSIASVASAALLIVLIITKHKVSLKQLELESKSLDKDVVSALEDRIKNIESQLEEKR